VQEGDGLAVIRPWASNSVTLVAQEIETSAATQATALAAANSYVPLVTSSASRDAFCATHNAYPPPMNYAFGAATAY